MRLLAPLLTLLLASGDDDAERASSKSKPFELYSNFDISHLVRPGMNWYQLLDIRQQLRRPSLAFYVDKVQYKTRMMEIGVDIPDIYYLRNVGADVNEIELKAILQSLQQTINRRLDYVAKPTHMSCSDGVYVVKNGWNIYPRKPELADSVQVATSLTQALQTQSSLLGESWALHQVPPGVIVEERISAGDQDRTAALEFKTIVIWGQVWAADVRRGTHSVQVLGRDGLGLLGESRDPSLAHVDWLQVKELAEKLGAHKDCFRVDIFVSPSSRDLQTTEPGRTSVLKYQVNEVEFYITSNLPLFDEAARLWLEGYYEKPYVLIPNPEISGPYADMQDPSSQEEKLLFADLGLELGWAKSFGESRTYGSLARPGAHGRAALSEPSNLSAVRPSQDCGGESSRCR